MDGVTTPQLRIRSLQACIPWNAGNEAIHGPLDFAGWCGIMGVVMATKVARKSRRKRRLSDRILTGRETTALAILAQDYLSPAMRLKLRASLKGSAARIATSLEKPAGRSSTTADERLAARSFVERYKALKRYVESSPMTSAYRSRIALYR